MNKSEFNALFEILCEGLKRSSGSIDTVQTSGVKILEAQGEHWIQHGASTFHDIHVCAADVEKMLAEYATYDDVKEQFMPDVFAILEDIAYHSSTLNIYYLSCRRLLLSGEQEDLSSVFPSGFREFWNSIDVTGILSDWKSNIHPDKKKEFVFEVAQVSFSIKAICEKIATYSKDDLKLNQEVSDLLNRVHYFTLKSMLLLKQIGFAVDSSTT
jgi:hypothetical protein